VQLNEPGNHKKTQRYLIEKNKAILLNEKDINAGKKLNNGRSTNTDRLLHRHN